MKPMSFNICKKYYLKKVEIDSDKIKSIISISKNRFKLIQTLTKNNKNEFTSIICENYYEIIKELLIALLLKKGLKSKNHECLIAFFKNKFPQYEKESIIIYHLKNKRNLLNYEGKLIEYNYLVNNEKEFLRIINLLTELINS